MYDRIHVYHFLLNNGQEFFGRVLAHDRDKVVINALGRREPPRRMILYQNSMVLAERLDDRRF